MNNKRPKRVVVIPTRNSEAARLVENIFKCKWTVSVLDLICQNICRPGQMKKSIPGITTKVLNDLLKKLCEWRIVERTVYPTLPPKVEYKLTSFGQKFMKVLKSVEELQKEIEFNKSYANTAESETEICSFRNGCS
ncbi:transcriptional regulator [Candidatus Methylacidiphilum fumarolicum]|uniref:Predicted transcriptional regulator n=2 Tax=Candidatus Methylacidiphilum fumarolicum TaxID=591154 RepID=I0JWU2_METFB|nr:helix-turn-helix domain-containing protein [Candidatus Methylacidiphilum fumarolicum]MBW6414405.1 helix-turn-helix transcriptional regulator [Candidatus Methylacidiphilum fumarolicum]TFE69410.1 transcriptional regulator [Candidatus Methylacidiphilum fumarolicum]TFE72885.1 transcriptional regulator [Candidatus Methylacidiphilum fumarolicum]TFE74628.1 transcriptional regulator [Candidatus Methylacidiphilum fumarolicum]TFE77194.1 transcriptional regulator [Candidatus Methylacidiphilum fumaroli